MAATPEGEPEAGEQDASPGPESEGGEHSVQDRYVARRLSESAARNAAEHRTTEETEGLTGDAVEDSPLGFYLALGVIVAALLLAVIWLNGTRRELPPGIIPAPAAPSARPGPAPGPLPTAPPGSPAPRLSPSAGPGTSPPAEGAPGGAPSPSLAPPSPAPGAAAPGQSPTEAPPAGPGSVQPLD